MRIQVTAARRDALPARELPQLREAMDVFGIPNDGPSPWGSTMHKKLLACMREFGLYERGIRTLTPSDALDTGILVHYAMELYYREIHRFQQEHPDVSKDEFYFGGQREGAQKAMRALDTLEGVKGYEKVVETAVRCMDAYLEQHMRRDRWEIVAVEETLAWDGERLPAEHPLAFRHSARLDLVIKEAGGVWLVEHKTAAFITAELVAHYEMDLQVLGQKWLWDHCVATKKYGDLKGVIVNIVSKQKEPRCVRVPVSPSADHLSEFENMMRTMPERKAWAERNGYPKSLGHCAGYARGYSRCDYYDLCHDFPSLTPKQWDKYELPERYVRVAGTD